VIGPVLMGMAKPVNVLQQGASVQDVVNLAAMTAALFAMLVYLYWRATPSARLAWDAPALDPHLLLVIIMIAAEMALLTAVALFFSSFSSSALWSVVFTLGVFVAGEFSGDLRAFGSVVETSPIVAAAVSTLCWVLPSFASFDIKAQVVHGIPLPPGFIGWTLAYALLYVGALIVAASTVFSRREFT